MYNLIFNLQFYFNIISTAAIFGMYTMIIDFSRKGLYDKIQHDSKRKLYNTYYKIIPNVLLNLFISNFMFSYFTFPLTLYYKHSPKNYYYLILFIKIFVMRFMTDFFFYYIHIFFHKYLYKYHKVHHQITAPVGISAFYMHPIDFIFGNLIPIYVPTLLLNADLLTVHIWTFMSVANTIIVSHGGFKNLSEFHDDHHRYFNCNYGTDVFMDELIKTKRVSKQSRYREILV